MKRHLRRFVVATAVPPWRGLYVALYRVLVWLASSVFRRCPGVVAVYLTRGAARQQLSPGISDLDFIVVTADEASRPRAQAAGRLLRRATAGLIDYYPNAVMSRRTFEQRGATAPAWQYRLHEGRCHWRLLYGEEILASLPPLTAGERRRASYFELCRWWLQFARMLDEGYHERDIVLRNVTCYKAATELLRVRATLANDAAELPSRDDALAGLATPLARRLRAAAAGRFLADDGDLVEATCGFLCGFFVDLWTEFDALPFLETRGGVSQSLGEADPEAALAPAVAAHGRALAEWVERNWGDHGGACHLLQSVCWDAAGWLFVVEGVARRPPPAARLAELVREHRRLQRAGRPAVELVLRLGSIGLPLTPEMPRSLHRGLLTPATTPDLFLELGEPAVYWTDFTDWYLAQWRSNEQWLAASPLQQRRLAAVAAGAAAGAIVYPLTRTTLLAAAAAPC